MRVIRPEEPGKHLPTNKNHHRPRKTQPRPDISWQKALLRQSTELPTFLLAPITPSGIMETGEGEFLPHSRNEEVIPPSSGDVPGQAGPLGSIAHSLNQKQHGKATLLSKIPSDAENKQIPSMLISPDG